MFTEWPNGLKLSARVFVFSLALGCGVPSAFGSFLNGTSVIGTYFDVTIGSGSVFYGPVTAVVGPGIEFSFTAGGDTLSSDFSDTGLTIAFQGVTTGVDSLSLTFQSLTPGDFGSVAALTNSFRSEEHTSELQS